MEVQDIPNLLKRGTQSPKQVLQFTSCNLPTFFLLLISSSLHHHLHKPSNTWPSLPHGVQVRFGTAVTSFSVSSAKRFQVKGLERIPSPLRSVIPNKRMAPRIPKIAVFVDFCWKKCSEILENFQKNRQS